MSGLSRSNHPFARQFPLALRFKHSQQTCAPWTAAHRTVSQAAPTGHGGNLPDGMSSRSLSLAGMRSVSSSRAGSPTPRKGLNGSGDCFGCSKTPPVERGTSKSHRKPTMRAVTESLSVRSRVRDISRFQPRAVHVPSGFHSSQSQQVSSLSRLEHFRASHSMPGRQLPGSGSATSKSQVPVPLTRRHPVGVQTPSVRQAKQRQHVA